MKMFEDTPNHTHNGIDSPKLQFKNLEGIPIFTSAPTFIAKEGTMVLSNQSGTYYIYVYINSTWTKVEIS